MGSDPLTQLLRLIDDGSDPDTISAACRNADVSGESASLANHLAERCRAESRSARLLATLYETASDLAAIRDTDAVLLAIVQRTRAVTGADMAYLSLNDHTTGETFIRQSDGVRTPEYASIRMPLGTGVLGKAATGLAVVSTSDYVDDPTIVHLDSIDDIVRAEGVRAILGVPMNVQGRIQGALLIADRSPVEYSPETREIVDAIALQAAVAIDYSARLAQLTSALQELGAKQDAGQARMRTLQTVLDLDRRMIEAVASRDQPAILALLGSVYGVGAELIAPDDPIDAPLRTAISTAVASGLPFPVALPDGPVTICAARVGGHHLGTVLVRTEVPVEQRDLLELGALHLGLSVLIDRIEADADRRSQYELLDDCISGRAVPGPELRSRLRRVGLDPRRPLTVLAISTGGRPDGAITAIRRALQKPTLVMEHGDHLCALVQAGEDPAARVHAALSVADPATLVGSSRVVGDLGDVPRAHRAAGTALASLRLLGGCVLDGDALGALGTLLEADLRGEFAVRAPAQPLLDYDEGHGTDLTRTAWAVLELGPQLPTTAAALFIHPNTLRQRMARIASLLGEGWATGPGRLDLHLALRAVMLSRRQTP